MQHDSIYYIHEDRRDWCVVWLIVWFIQTPDAIAMRENPSQLHADYKHIAPHHQHESQIKHIYKYIWRMTAKRFRMGC